MPQSKRPLFPPNVEESVIDLDTKRKHLKTNASRFGIPTVDISRMDTAVNAAQAAYTVASAPLTRSQLDIATRDLAIETAQGIERKLIDFYVVDNQSATEVDYEILRIPRPGPHPHLPDPKNAPGMILTSRQLAIILSFFDMITGHRGKPKGVQSIEICYKIGGEPPVSPEEMTERMIGTDTPVRIPFDYNQIGMVVHLVARWVGTRGVYGPWSEIYKIIILR
jgi:hypothetical protein